MRGESRKTILEIGDEVLRIFEADMQPQIWSRRFPTRRGANSLRMGGNDQAFEAAPAPAQLEQPQTVQHGIDPRFGDGMQDDAEQAASSGEIALPQIMTARAGQRREDHFG